MTRNESYNSMAAENGDGETAPLLGGASFESSVPLNDNAKTPSPALNLETLKRLGRIMRLILSKRSAILWLIVLFLVSLAIEVAIYFSGMRTSLFFTFLLRRDAPGFIGNTGILLAAFVTIALLHGLSKLAGGYFALIGRRRVSAHLQSLLVTRNSLYRICKTQEYVTKADNPDQRICQDADKLAAGLRTLLESLVVTPLSILFYTFMVWKVGGGIAVAMIYCYYLITGLLSWLLMRPLVTIIFQKERAEGDWRYLHVHVRDEAETVSFEKGYKAERNSLDYLLAQVMSWQGVFVRQESILNMGTTLFAYVGGILCYASVAIPVLWTHEYDDMPADRLSQLVSLQVFTCIYLSSRFSGIIAQAQQISDIAGYTNRLGTLWESLLEEDDRAVVSKELGTVKVVNDETCFTHNGVPAADHDEFISFKSVSISTPAIPPRLLLDDLNIKLKQNDRVVLIGPNGQGKTSIVRVLARLWTCESGDLVLPGTDADNYLEEPPIVFVPQFPYLPLSSLRALVAYPLVETTVEAFPDTDVVLLLSEFGLDKLVELVRQEFGSFDAEIMPQFWERNLSPGLKQRLGFARLFYHLDRRKRGLLSMPFVVMDESTSSVDPETARWFLDQLESRFQGVGWLRISHAQQRDTLAGERMWKLAGGKLGEEM